MNRIYTQSYTKQWKGITTKLLSHLKKISYYQFISKEQITA